MSIADEIAKLDGLRERGVLSAEEFAAAKARVLAGEPAGMDGVPAAINRFRRSRSDRWIGGVCGGIGRLSGIESWVWRLVWTVFALFGGAGVVAYLLCWIFVPDENAG